MSTANKGMFAYHKRFGVPIPVYDRNQVHERLRALGDVVVKFVPLGRDPHKIERLTDALCSVLTIHTCWW